MMAADWDRLAFARGILRAEASSLEVVANRLDDGFERVVDLLLKCQGRIVVTGVGKSLDVGQKLVGTLNSTGSRALLLDPLRALHGDLGAVHPNDVALLLSHSGESEELLRLVSPLRRLCRSLTAITSRPQSTLAQAVDAAIVYGQITEACPLALAPSTSTTVMLALGDAIAFTLCELKKFTADEFARYHPAGSLGRKLATVESCMRRGAELRIASCHETVRHVFMKVRHQGRRTGAIILVDDQNELAGLFTDSDLARLFENRNDAALDRPISEVMTRRPVVVAPSCRLSEAIDLMRSRKISELPVVDSCNRPVGMLDITDLIGLEPMDSTTLAPPSLRLHNRLSA